MALWRGKTVLVTAGPTREHLDPVRFLSNASSGKMGYALARAARRRGARVILVSGPTALKAPAGVRRVPVVSARQMHEQVLRRASRAHLVLAAAAVADWRPARYSPRKLKKSARAAVPFPPLRRNPDILASLGRLKPRPRLVGFALETHRAADFAREKMRAKNLDLIVANGPAALEGDSTRALLLPRHGPALPFRGSKTALARAVLDHCEAFFHEP
jgi:phosphopantothenoylcysteine decarboxylase/phosphopantothenate--cysteine ligase